MPVRTIFRALALAAVLCVLWTGAACAEGSLGIPDAASIAALQQAADKGDAQAQYELGSMYWDAYGVPQDRAKAAALLQKAADQGNASAQVSLGIIYEKGLGVPKDLVKAAAFYQKAADQGDPSALYALGTMYVEGKGVPKNAKKGCSLLCLAMAAGRITIPRQAHEVFHRYCAK